MHGTIPAASITTAKIPALPDFMPTLVGVSVAQRRALIDLLVLGPAKRTRVGFLSGRAYHRRRTLRILHAGKFVTFVETKKRHLEARLTDYGRWYAQAAFAAMIGAAERREAASCAS